MHLAYNFTVFLCMLMNVPIQFTKSTKFYSEKDIAITSQISFMKSIFSTSVVHCAMLCDIDVECQSGVYDQHNDECSLFSTYSPQTELSYGKWILSKELDKTKYLKLQQTRLWHHQKSSERRSLWECIYECEHTIDCVALTICTDCEFQSLQCSMFTEDSTYSYASFDDIWTAVIVWTNMRNQIMMVRTNVIGQIGIQDTENPETETSELCGRKCKEDCCCTVFSYDQMAICKLFTSENIHFLEGKEDSTTFFIARN